MFLTNEGKIIGFKVLKYKNMIFDEWTENEYGIYAEMCEHCLKKYRDRMDLKIDSSGGVGACSIRGCEFVGDDDDVEMTYIDFDINGVEIIEETLEELIGKLKKLEVTYDDVIEELEYRDRAAKGMKWDDNLYEYTTEELEILADEWGNYTNIEHESNISFYVSKDDDCGIRTFEFIVTRDFLKEFLDGEQTVKEFLDDYTSDDSLSLYLAAVLEGKLISVSGDCWLEEDDEHDY